MKSLKSVSVIIIAFIFLVSCRSLNQNNNSDEQIVSNLFKNSYNVFEQQRNSIGVYRDSILLGASDTNYHPSSVAATGIGLMTLTIADQMNWENNALEKAKQTIQTMTGAKDSFNVKRNANGYYYHFINMDTGAQEWNSEFSTIDTAIFMSGAIFAKNYFKDAELSQMVDDLYRSIDFEASIANAKTGAIYLTMNEDGRGEGLTLPYNEYIIVAWLAYNQNIDNQDSKAVQFWNKYYKDSTLLLKKDYEGISLLTDNKDHYLSSFTLLFPYYMVNMFSKSNEYNAYLHNAYEADKLFFKQSGLAKNYEWGSGAGASISGSGYHADSINDNVDMIVSPHIIAGFIPINEDGVSDLIELYKNDKGLYQLPNTNKEILWRYSLTLDDWSANSIQAIDYSTFIFGLATLGEGLGLSFFQDNNDMSNMKYQ